MTQSQIQEIRRTIVLLSTLIDEPQWCAGKPWQSPVRYFVHAYLTPDPTDDISCAEAWTLFQEIAQEGELSAMTKAVFLRQQPIAIQPVYDLRKSHHIERSGHRVRGFRGVGIRLEVA